LGIVILTTIAVAVGLFLLIVPGLYLFVTLSLALPLYISFREHGLDIFDSMHLSRKVTRKKFWEIAKVLGCLILFFVLACLTIVGVVIAIPMVYWIIAFMIQDIFSISNNCTPTPV